MKESPKVSRLVQIFAIALAAALPSILYVARGTSFIVDDWSFIRLAKTKGFAGFFGINSSRPIQELYLGAVFNLLTNHLLAHLILLAVLNVVLALLVWRLLLRIVEPRPAFIAAVVFSLLSGRGATRFWPSDGQIVLALIFLTTAWLLVEGKKRTISRECAAVGLAVCGLLTYEGVTGLVVLFFVIEIYSIRRRPNAMSTRTKTWMPVGILVAFVVCLSWILHATPKHLAHDPTPFSNIYSAFFGRGIVPSWAYFVPSLILLLVPFALWQLMEKRKLRSRGQFLVLCGFVMFIFGVGPVAVVGFPIQTVGLLDRVNIFGQLGVALMIAGAISYVDNFDKKFLSLVFPIFLIGVLASNNLEEIDGFSDAAKDTQNVLYELQRLPDSALNSNTLIQALPNRNGVSDMQFEMDVVLAYADTYGIDVKGPLLATSSDQYDHWCAGLRFKLQNGKLVQDIPCGAPE